MRNIYTMALLLLCLQSEAQLRPIYTSYIHDKRLLAYNDSLVSYQNNKLFWKHCMVDLPKAKSEEELQSIVDNLKNRFPYNTDIAKNLGDKEITRLIRVFSKTTDQLQQQFIFFKPKQPVIYRKYAPYMIYGDVPDSIRGKSFYSLNAAREFIKSMQ